MENVSQIRRWVLVEGRSILSVARATGLLRDTIKKYLKDESPPSYQRQVPPVRNRLIESGSTQTSLDMVTSHQNFRHLGRNVWPPTSSIGCEIFTKAC